MTMAAVMTMTMTRMLSTHAYPQSLQIQQSGGYGQPRMIRLIPHHRRLIPPSTPFGTKLSLTTKPMGKSTKSVTSTVRDTGNFGAAGEVNKSTDMDLTRQTARDLTGDDKLTPTQWGKRMIYKKLGK